MLTIDRLDDSTYLIDAGRNKLYLLYSMRTKPNNYHIVMGKIRDVPEIENQRLVSLSRECYSTDLYDVDPRGPVSVMNDIIVYVQNGIDLDDPVELVLNFGGISNNSLLICPERSRC